MQARLDTLAVHAGQVPDPATGARAVPIYETTSFVFRDADHAAAAFALQEPANIYTRLGNPTIAVLEARLAALHGAAGAIAFSSGQAATTAMVFGLCRAGQNFVCAASLYGGTHTLFRHTFGRLGIEARFVDSSDPEAWRAAADADTRFFFVESVDNPRGRVADLEALAHHAHAIGCPLVVDNTFVPPPVFDPFDHGADLVVYSLTKMIGGHGAAIGGAVVEKGDFDWSAHGKYPLIAGPDPANHGYNVLKAVSGRGANGATPAFVTHLFLDARRDMGACLSPFSAWALLLGTETLPLRARQHCANAGKVAARLAANPGVAWVDYAGLPSHPDHARAAMWMPMGPGAVMAFGLKGGRDAGRTFIGSVKLASHLANVLDAKTLVIHPATTTHSQMTEEELKAAGIGADLVRLSVGIEDVDDILEDLERAIAAAR